MRTPKGSDVNGRERGAIVLPSGREAIRRFEGGDRKKWIRHYDIESVEEHDLLNRQGAKKDRKRQN